MRPIKHSCEIFGLKRFLCSLLMVFLSLPALAIENDPLLRVEDLLANGFKKMTGAEIRQQLFGKQLMIQDLQARSEYLGSISKTGVTQLNPNVS